MNAPLPGSFTLLENFGHSLKTPAYLSKPESVEAIAAAFRYARSSGLTLTPRGAGRSYNDAAMNGGGIVLDLQRMNRILAWDPLTGIIRVEPGVTLRDLWEKVLPDGWWPPVVSGTMTTTLGGCLAANIHGKNNFRMGTIGEHVLEFDALLPTGAELTCAPAVNGDLFRAMIGGLGMLGVFTSIQMQMKKVHSGLLAVHAWNVANLDTHLDDLGNAAREHNYAVGWLDPVAGGKALGRGQLHAADYLAEGEDPQADRMLRVASQTLPANLFGVVPKSLIQHFMAPFMNNPGAWGINTAKYHLGRRSKVFRQSHAAFHFLLDYVPDWERAYGQLIQYQSFLPEATARAAWTEMLRLSQRSALPSYLGVTKRHRRDTFLLSHGVDGYSLALDFKVSASNRSRLAKMLADFYRIVLEAGGRFYFAKNSETSAETTRCFLGADAVAKYLTMKKRCDPDNLLCSDLFRRLFGNTP